MKFDNYIFRCHYQGDLVSVPRPLTENQKETLHAYRERRSGVGRPLTEKQNNDLKMLEVREIESKKYKLSETAKKICTKIAFSEIYGRSFKMTNKYFVKGLEVEKKSRDLLSKILDKMLVKCDERKSNDWVTGQIDVEPFGIIPDIKSCYSFDTFNNHLIDGNIDYYKRQLDCYMELWGIHSSIIAFTLIDTPFRLIEDEIRKLDWRVGITNFEGEIYDDKIEEVVDLVQEHIYTRKHLEEFCNQSASIHIEWFDNFIEIPDERRVHLIPHEFSKERIEQRNECLRLAREFMNEIKPINNLTI